MSTNDGVARVCDTLASAWASHDTERVLACFADDCVYEDVAMGLVLHGHEELRHFAAEIFENIPDFTYEPTGRVVGDTNAAIEYWLGGTPRFGPDGAPSAGLHGRVRCVSILEVDGDLIIRNADYWDANTLFAQLSGAEPG